MEFTEVLKPETIVTHLNVKDKAEALNAMTDLFVKAGIVDDKEQYIKDVYEREAVGETGIGDYIAIPHGKSKAVVTPGVAIAVLDHEIEWESLDGTGAKLVILFAVGADNEAAQEHLKLLAMFSKRLGDDAVTGRLMNADTTEDVMEALLGESEEAVETEESDEELDPDEIEIM